MAPFYQKCWNNVDLQSLVIVKNTNITYMWFESDNNLNEPKSVSSQINVGVKNQSINAT